MSMLDLQMVLTSRPSPARLVEALRPWFDDVFWPTRLDGRIGTSYFDLPPRPENEPPPCEVKVSGTPWTVAVAPNNIVMDTLARETADPTRVVDMWIQGGLLLQDPRADASAAPAHVASVDLVARDQIERLWFALWSIEHGAART